MQRYGPQTRPSIPGQAAQQRSRRSGAKGECWRTRVGAVQAALLGGGALRRRRGHHGRRCALARRLLRRARRHGRPALRLAAVPARSQTLVCRVCSGAHMPQEGTWVGQPDISAAPHARLVMSPFSSGLPARACIAAPFCKQAHSRRVAKNAHPTRPRARPPRLPAAARARPAAAAAAAAAARPPRRPCRAAAPSSACPRARPRPRWRSGMPARGAHPLAAASSVSASRCGTRASAPASTPLAVAACGRAGALATQWHFVASPRTAWLCKGARHRSLHSSCLLPC